MILFLFFVFSIINTKPSVEHLVFNKNSDFELDVFKINGSEPGNTIMIIGGIQGDEDAGYLTADFYTNIRLKKGNLIVVPRANFPSIIKNSRQINQDMNRRFDTPINEIEEDKVVSVLKKLMFESDLMLNLHEGSGFYSNTYISEMENPKRFGQCIIADTEVFYSKKYNKNLELKKMAERVIESVNKKTENPRYWFRFNNHNTADIKTMHPEQRKSATYFALYEAGIPAFGLEISKVIKDTELKVRMHSMLINAFMNEMEIIPETPSIDLFPPILKYLLIKVNGEYRVLKSDDSLIIPKGTSIEARKIISNYDRGLSLDILNYGSIQDLEKRLEINTDTKIIVKKDSTVIGSIPIYVEDIKSKDELKIAPKFLWLLVRVNDKEFLIHKDEVIDVYEGDSFELVEAVFYPYVKRSDLIVNFVGYYGGTIYGIEDDLGLKFIINGSLLKRFAVSKDLYSIYVKYKNIKIAFMNVRVNRPKVKYFIFEDANNKKLCFTNNERIEILNQDLKFFDIVGDIDTTNLKINILDVYFNFNELKEKTINSFLELVKNKDLLVNVIKDNFIIGSIVFYKKN